MHKKFAKNGVVIMSVSLDTADTHDQALAFLKKQGAAFLNYRLDEEMALAAEKFDMNGPPAAFVFNRAGKRAAKFNNNDPDKQYDNADVEKFVERLLAAER